MRIRTTLAVLLGVGAVAGADQIKIGGLEYDNVKITGTDGLTIAFTVAAGGRTITKDLADVKHLAIEGQLELNRAEQLLVQGKPAEACEAYLTAANIAAKPWMKQLIRFRRFQAAQQAGKIGAAVRLWIEIGQDNKWSAKVLKLRPATPAAKASRENAEAITLLEAARKKPPDNKAWMLATGRLLLDLYEREGLKEKASSLAKEIAAGGGPGPRVPAATTAEQIEAQLGSASLLIGEQEIDSVSRGLAAVEKVLPACGEAQLPTALLLAGKAQYSLFDLGGRKEADRPRLLKGGLSLMRVVVFFGGAPEARESLYLAGQVNLALGNREAARASWREIVERAGKTDIGKKAQGALEKLGK